MLMGALRAGFLGGSLGRRGKAARERGGGGGGGVLGKRGRTKGEHSQA